MILFDGQLDVHIASMLEQKFDKSRFVRVDSDTIENLIPKADIAEVTLTDAQKENLSEAFKSQLPAIEKAEFTVEYRALSEQDEPVQITQNEFMRRMKEMSVMQSGMGLYGDMPFYYNLVLNIEHPLIKKILGDVDGKDKEAVDKYAGENTSIRQLVDLALLSNGMLKGESLNNFVKRNMAQI